MYDIPYVDSLSCNSITIEGAQLTGSAKITSYPPGAKIFLNNVEQELVTPALITNLPPNTYIYKLTYPRYIEAEGIMIINAGETYPLFVIMERAPGIEISPIWYFIFGAFTFSLLMALYRKKKEPEA